MNSVIYMFYLRFLKYKGNNIVNVIEEQNAWLDKTGIINHKNIVDFYRTMRKCINEV